MSADFANAPPMRQIIWRSDINAYYVNKQRWARDVSEAQRMTRDTALTVVHNLRTISDKLIRYSLV